MNSFLCRQLVFLIVVVMTCYCSRSAAQNKGLTGGLNSADKTSKNSSAEDQIDENSWKAEGSFADPPEAAGAGGSTGNDATSKQESVDKGAGSNAVSGSSGTSRPSESEPSSTSKESANSKGPSLDSRIRRLQHEIDRLQRKRDSKQVLNQISSIENAEKVADRYRVLTEREIQRATDRNEPWRKSLIDSLRNRMKAAEDLLQEIVAERNQPGGISENVAINRLNHALLDVYLAALRLRMAELKWKREAEFPAFQISVKARTLSLDFISWENSPALDALVVERGGIVGNLKEVKERMGARSIGPVSMLATFQLNLKAHLWEFEGRFHEVSFTPVNSPVPVIPDAMTKKAMLRLEASQTAIDMALLTYPLSVDDMATLREEGELEIDLFNSRPVQGLQHWVLTDFDNAKIVLIRVAPDSSKTGDHNATPENETSDDKETNSESDKGRAENESDETDANDASDTQTGSDESNGLGASTDTIGDEPKDKDKGSGGEKDRGNRQDDDPEEGGAKVGFDDNNDQRPPKKDKQTGMPENDVLSPDLDFQPGQSVPKQDSNEGKGESQDRSASTGQAVEGNWLSIDGVQRMIPQRVHGFWENTQNGDVDWFEVEGDRLVVRPTDNLRAMGIDVDRRKNSNRYYGRAYTVPLAGNCTHVGFWQPAALRISQGRTRGKWKGKKVEEDTCKLGELPDGGDLSFDRILVTSFQPLANGKLLHVTAAPSVGNQRSQLKAAAKISIRQFDVPGATAKVYLEQQQLQRSANGDAFDFITTRSGRHRLRVDILTSEGKLLHQEDIRIDVPGISGIGN